MRESGMSDFTKDYIDKMIQYETWSYPDTVRNILFLQYQNITKDKYYADMRYYHEHKE